MFISTLFLFSSYKNISLKLIQFFKNFINNFYKQKYQIYSIFSINIYTIYFLQKLANKTMFKIKFKTLDNIRCSVKILFWRNLTTFIWKHLWQSGLIITLQPVSLQLEGESGTVVFRWMMRNSSENLFMVLLSMVASDLTMV